MPIEGSPGEADVSFGGEKLPPRLPSGLIATASHAPLQGQKSNDNGQTTLSFLNVSVVCSMLNVMCMIMSILAAVLLTL